MSPPSSEPVRATFGETRLTLVQGNIVKEEVDAVVNAANSSLMGGGGVDGAIHRAGGPEILEECKKIREKRGRLPAGQAVSTTAGKMPARWVIHTVGPVWDGGAKGEEEALASCYRESIRVARGLGARTVAFPSISTGAYRYPVELASETALGAVRESLSSGPALDEVRFVLFDETTFNAYKESLKKLTEEST
jgi:O-acetyl-ADP-ribose deacetylase (regulator of RNase III)